MLNFARRQRTGRLIKGDDARVARQRFGDFDHLPLAERQVFQRHVGIDIHAKVFQLQTGFVAQQLTVNQPALVRQLAKIDVLRHAHFRYQMQLLVNDRHAGIQRINGIAEAFRCAFDADFAAAGLIAAAEDFQQRGFARAVLPH